MQTYENWVLQTYELLPTDSRFLDLTPWECEYLYWSRTMWTRMHKRLSEKRPVTTIEHVLEEELFEEELARREAESDREVREALEREAAERARVDIERANIESVSTWKAREPPP